MTQIIEQCVRDLERATRGNGGGPRLDLSKLTLAEIAVIMRCPLDGRRGRGTLEAELRGDPERLWSVLRKVRLGSRRLPPEMVDSWAELLIDRRELEDPGSTG